MTFHQDEVLYRCAETAMVRATPHASLPLPAWPDFTQDSPGHVAEWCAWLRDVWSVEEVAEAIEHASPVLAQQVATVCSAAKPD
ncbi:hypothetical protein ACFQ07_34355, partial [Actinomadura adrarensis]